MADDLQSTKSIFDFIYIDQGRVSAYHSQLFDMGALKFVNESTQTGDGSESRGYADAAGFVGGSYTSVGSTQRRLERQYDASWVGSLNVLSELDNLGYINHSLEDARIGELVLLKGSLSVLDIRIFRHVWKPFLELAGCSATDSGNRHERRSAASKSRNKGITIKNDLELIGDILPHLPHRLQMTITTPEGDQPGQRSMTSI